MKVTLFRPKVRGKKGPFYLKWRDADGRERRISTGTADRKLAESIRANLQDELLRDAWRLPQTARDFTWQDAWKAYLEAHIGAARKTVECREAFWRDFFEVTGRPTLRSVKPTDVQRFQRMRLAGGVMRDDGRQRAANTPTTVNNKLRACSAIVEHLIRSGLFDGENVFKRVPKLKQAPRRAKFLPWDTIQAILSAARDHGRDIHLFIILGALAGLRRGEILSMTWDRVDWTRGVLRVPGTKTEASAGIVPLHADLRDALEPYREQSGYIVAPHAEGKVLRWDARKPFAAVLRAAGVEHATPHMLRHSVATRLLDLGHSRAEIAAFLRHKSLAATEIYADVAGVSIDLGRISI